MATIDHLAFAMSREDLITHGPGVETGARGPAPTLYMNEPNKHLIEIRTSD
ncbi:MAG: hypothetical protein V7638_4790 [Acidobacteriota bacterium]|jgi:hypothetical protein